MKKSILISIILMFAVQIIFICFTTSCNKENETLKESEFRLIFPNGGELLEKGNVYEIVWSNNLSENVRIELFYNEEKVETITNSTKNNGKFLWEVTNNIEDGTYYKIQIEILGTESSSDKSDSRFIVTESIETSIFTDPKDGQVYQTVKIGDQWWMAENYNYEAEIGSSCYFNDTLFCEQYGKLYTQQSAFINNPPGWHLPTDEDWKILEEYLGIPTSSLDIDGYRGSFTGELMKVGGGSGFNVIWAGYCNARVNKFGHLGYEARFWSSTIVSDEQDYWVRLFNISKGGIDRMNMKQDFGASVRYIKDN